VQDAGWLPEEVQRALQLAHEGDHRFDDGSILGSMCTQPHELATLAHTLFAATNLGDPDHFPETARMEQEVLADLTSLLHAPEGASGRFLTGGTEANLFAMFVAREATGKRHVVVPEHAHFSFQKAALILGMELTWVPSTTDFRADVDAMAAAIRNDTALVVAVAGTTELGLVDPIAKLAEICRKREVRLHVDAAFGGYVLPFIDNAPPFDFQELGVWSISLDPHKMGRSVIPAGCLIIRDGTDWNHVAVETPYVSTAKQSQLLGTRPGAAVAATWAVHRALGQEGYRQQTMRCLEVRDYLISGLAERGHKLVSQPQLNVVTFRVDDPVATMDALTRQGVRVNVVPRFAAIRIVVGPHVTHDAIDRLFLALETLHATTGQ
jgi:tyrosine decarboxylase/aspartate 1-decarboxylase